MKTKTLVEKPLTALPKIVSREEWQRARDQLLVKEKAATKARDALNAERRRLPMVRIEKDYVFDGPKGKVRLLDLFEGRRQLIVYHFMFAPGVGGWPTAGCPGCSMVVDHIGPLEHLYARDTSFVLVLCSGRWPVPLEAYKQRMGWKAPWVSSASTSFNVDFGLSTAEEGTEVERDPLPKAARRVRAAASMKPSASAPSCATGTRSITPISLRIARWRRWIRISRSSTGQCSDVRKPGKTPRPAGPNQSPMNGGAGMMSIDAAERTRCHGVPKSFFPSPSGVELRSPIAREAELHRGEQVTVDEMPLSRRDNPKIRGCVNSAPIHTHSRFTSRLGRGQRAAAEFPIQTSLRSPGRAGCPAVLWDLARRWPRKTLRNPRA